MLPNSNNGTDPTLSTLLQGHLSLLGVSDITAGPIDGQGPEGLEIGAPNGRILISVSNEVLSVPLGTTNALLAIHQRSDADQDTLFHSTTEAPVTAIDLQVMAAKVATALHAAGQGESLPREGDTPTVREVLMGMLRRAGFTPRPYALNGFDGVEAHCAFDASLVIYNPIGYTLNLPLTDYPGLRIVRYEPGFDPTTDDVCPGTASYALWDAPVPSRGVLHEMTSAVVEITDDAAHPWY